MNIEKKIVSLQVMKSFSLNISALVEPSDRILVAVSGGLDSVVLLDLLNKHGMNDLAIVHCNFQLRGKESDEDEKFVKNLAKSYGLPFFCKRFDTETEQKKSKQSVQMVARNLRYTYFSELLKKEKYNYVAVAHHADDQIETFFINLLRGAGVKGLRGMLPKREQTIRPLLKFSRQDLENYAIKNNLKHCEDTTNSDDYYLRNNIRHHLIPCLETLDKSAKTSILQSMENLQDLETQSLQDLETLQNCGFSATQIRNIQKTLDGQSGKQFISKTHRAITHNGQLIIEPLFNADCTGAPTCAPLSAIVTNDHKDAHAGASLRIDLVNIENFTLNTNPNIAQLDFDKLQFPLTLRRWKKGDFFVPFGQRGKQKLSDFFINRKLSRFEKERVWLLCSGENIVWVVGYRIDNRYQISAKTEQVLIIETL
ncbi:MAG: tRNA lysidine(34) synthetase TilS [Bacteroidales bacterium]|nr:tRNA lysidine(34) synthetase TilS [Bacteroidales bacterium]